MLGIFFYPMFGNLFHHIASIGFLLFSFDMNTLSPQYTSLEKLCGSGSNVPNSILIYFSDGDYPNPLFISFIYNHKVIFYTIDPGVLGGIVFFCHFFDSFREILGYATIEASIAGFFKYK